MQILPIGIEVYDATENSYITLNTGASSTGSIGDVTTSNIKISATGKFDNYSPYGDFPIQTFFELTPVFNAVKNLWLTSGGYGSNFAFAQVTYSSSVNFLTSSASLNMSIQIIYTGSTIMYTILFPNPPAYMCVFDKSASVTSCDASLVYTVHSAFVGSFTPGNNTNLVIYADAKLDTYTEVPIATFLGAPNQNKQITFNLNLGARPNCFVANVQYFFNPSIDSKEYPLTVSIVISPNPSNSACANTSLAAAPNTFNPNAALAAFRSFYTSPFRAPAPAYASLSSVSMAAVANQCTTYDTDSHTISICKKK